MKMIFGKGHIVPRAASYICHLCRTLTPMPEGHFSRTTFSDTRVVCMYDSLIKGRF